MGIMGWFVLVAFTGTLCFLCFKFGQNKAWNYIAQNYIAIHKSAFIGPILIKKGEKEHAKRKPTFAHKKAFKQKR